MDESIETKIKIAEGVHDSGTTGIKWNNATEELNITKKELLTYLPSRSILGELVAVTHQNGVKLLMPYEKLYLMNKSDIREYFQEKYENQ